LGHLELSSISVYAEKGAEAAFLLFSVQMVGVGWLEWIGKTPKIPGFSEKDAVKVIIVLRTNGDIPGTCCSPIAACGLHLTGLPSAFHKSCSSRMLLPAHGFWPEHQDAKLMFISPLIFHDI
jgi:hypothetical protein